MKVSELFFVARVSALFAFAAGFLAIGVIGLTGAQAQSVTLPHTVDAIEYEHRVTTLETSMKGIADAQGLIVSQLNDLRTTKWLELVALSALMGETGVRTFKGRLGKES